MSHIPARALLVVRLAIAGLLLSLVGGIHAVAQDATPSTGGPEPLTIPLIDATGADAGSAVITEQADGALTIAVDATGLSEGDHGIHVHAVGLCDPSGEQPFSTAGPHYNPTGGMHDGPPAEGELATPTGDPMLHAGDLGNITAAADGSATLDATTSRFTLSAGPRSLNDSDGSALVIHQNPDDLSSQPSGASGGRVLCGVIAAPREPMGTPVPATPEVATVEASILTPEQIPFSEELLANLSLPEGFEISVYAQGLANPRMMAYGPDGTLYVTEPAGNAVLALRDTDGDGAADESFPAAANLPFVHGIAFHENRVYLAGEKQVWAADITPEGAFGEPRVILDNLPDGDQHFRRTLAIGPDGMIYVSLGSSCNVCIESNNENATMIRANLDGSGREIVATGLRNTIGFAWEPTTGGFWGWDQGSDFRGDDQPPEELNEIVPGGNYGWPFCFGDREADIYGPYTPQGATTEQYCENTKAPALTYTAHSSPIAFLFYTADQFPADYNGDAFVAMRGSWNRDPASGYEVLRVDFEDGRPISAEPFITGWLLPGGAAQFGRIAGLTIASDGSMLISDDANGVIYRVGYTGS